MQPPTILVVPASKSICGATCHHLRLVSRLMNGLRLLLRSLAETTLRWLLYRLSLLYNWGLLCGGQLGLQCCQLSL